MAFSNFTPYFELLAGLNLAYAGLKRFGNLDEKMLSMRVQPSLSKIKEMLSAIDIFELAQDLKQRTQDRIAKIDANYSEKMPRYIKEAEADIQFGEGFLGAFLATGIFCAAMVLMGSYEEALLNGGHFNFIAASVWWGAVVLVFNFVIFARSFHHRYCGKSLALSHILMLAVALQIPFVWWFVPFIGRTVSEKETLAPYFDANVYWCVIAAMSAYFFLFTRIAFHRIYYGWNTRLLHNITLEEINLLPIKAAKDLFQNYDRPLPRYNLFAKKMAIIWKLLKSLP